MTKPKVPAKPRRDYQASGVCTLKRQIRARKRRGRGVLDGRTRDGKELAALRAELLADYGGLEGMSAAQRIALDIAVAGKLILGRTDNFILRLPSVANRRTRDLLPCVKQRTPLADSVLRALASLGPPRRARRTNSYVSEVLDREKTPQRAPAPAPAPAPVASNEAEAALDMSIAMDAPPEPTSGPEVIL